jgi:hypothetical protein
MQSDGSQWTISTCPVASQLNRFRVTIKLKSFRRVYQDGKIPAVLGSLPMALNAAFFVTINQLGAIVDND